MCQTSGSRILLSRNQMWPCSYPSAPLFSRARPLPARYYPESWGRVLVRRWTRTGSTRALGILVVRSTASRRVPSASRDIVTMVRSSRKFLLLNKMSQSRRARGTSTASSWLSTLTCSLRDYLGSSSTRSRPIWASPRSSSWMSCSWNGGTTRALRASCASATVSTSHQEGDILGSNSEARLLVDAAGKTMIFLGRYV